MRGTFRFYFILALMATSLSLISGAQAQIETKLTASDGGLGDSFGSTVAISGYRAVVVAQLDDDPGLNAGSAYVFELQNDAWVQTAKLVASDASVGDNFGFSVSFEGDRILFGVPSDDIKGFSSGSVYVFEYQKGAWVETATLTANDGNTNDAFGRSVSLSGDRAIIGAYHDNDNGLNSGSAYVFEYENGSWSQTAKLTASDGAENNRFGGSSSLVNNRAIIGSFEATYIFELNDNTWTEAVKLVASDGEAFDDFGRSVALSSDWAIIGAPGDDDQGLSSGSAYVFELQNGVWTEVQKLIPADGGGNKVFGRRISISENWALIGAHLDDEDGINSGSAYLFERQNGTWQQLIKLTADDGDMDDFFGYGIALSAKRAIVGARWEKEIAHNAGAAYIYEFCEDKDAAGRQINCLKGFTNELHDVSQLQGRHQRKLLGFLDQALRLYEGGNPEDAMKSMEQFIAFVEQLLNLNRIPNYTAQYMIARAGSVIVALGNDTFNFSIHEVLWENGLVQSAQNPLAILSNHPNPFNPSTTLRFALAEQAQVRLTVYDMLGREVERLVEGVQEAGTHEVTFDASGLPSGTYMYILETPEGSFVQKMQLLK